MKRTTGILVVGAFVLGGLVGTYALLPARTNQANLPVAVPHPVWHEVRWPFALDQWGTGKAFQCKAADCGAEVNVYIRAKIGFCNCTTGVSDDEELDRISDFDLFGNRLAAQGPGRPIAVAWMKGRSRSFTIAGAPQTALSVGFNDHCDAIVATAVIERGEPTTLEPAVIGFLNSQTVIRWAQVTLGL
jgi:hypothetical protein